MKMIDKAIFIIPFFGKFNNYFQLFLNSCSYQKKFDFLIITDDKTSYHYPDNITVKLTEFDQFISYINQKINSKIEINDPQKLCDFKPVYGYLFENIIKDYSYWGYCDTDVILGDLDSLVFPLISQNYDKIFNLGHMTLIKNTMENNRIFLKAVDEDNNYSPIFSINEGKKFDEEKDGLTISNLYLEYGKSIFVNQIEADIYTKSSNFYIDYYSFDRNSHDIVKEKNLFIYHNGKLFNLKSGLKSSYEEYSYIHLQKRPMEVKVDLLSNSYKIIPNAFEYLEVPFDKINSINFKNIKNKNLNFQYFRLRLKNLKTKLIRKFSKC